MDIDNNALGDSQGWCRSLKVVCWATAYLDDFPNIRPGLLQQLQLLSQHAHCTIERQESGVTALHENDIAIVCGIPLPLRSFL